MDRQRLQQAAVGGGQVAGVGIRRGQHHQGAGNEHGIRRHFPADRQGVLITLDGFRPANQLPGAVAQAGHAVGAAQFPAVVRPCGQRLPVHLHGQFRPLVLAQEFALHVPNDGLETPRFHGGQRVGAMPQGIDSGRPPLGLSQSLSGPEMQPRRRQVVAPRGRFGRPGAPSRHGTIHISGPEQSFPIRLRHTGLAGQCGAHREPPFVRRNCHPTLGLAATHQDVNAAARRVQDLHLFEMEVRGQRLPPFRRARQPSPAQQHVGGLDAGPGHGEARLRLHDGHVRNRRRRIVRPDSRSPHQPGQSQTNHRPEHSVHGPVLLSRSRQCVHTASSL